MIKDDLKKALINNRRYIEDKLQTLLNEQKFDEIFEVRGTTTFVNNSCDNFKEKI